MVKNMSTKRGKKKHWIANIKFKLSFSSLNSPIRAEVNHKQAPSVCSVGFTVVSPISCLPSSEVVSRTYWVSSPTAFA